MGVDFYPCSVCKHVVADCSDRFQCCDECCAKFCGWCSGKARIKWGKAEFCTECIRVEGLFKPASDHKIAKWWFEHRMDSELQAFARRAYEEAAKDPLIPNNVCVKCEQEAPSGRNYLDSRGYCDECSEKRRLKKQNRLDKVYPYPVKARKLCPQSESDDSD